MRPARFLPFVRRLDLRRRGSISRTGLKPNTRRVWLGLATLFISLRAIVLFLACTGALSGDGPGYLDAARHFGDTGTLPFLRIQPHGYPVFIAPIVATFSENSIVAVQIVQALLDLALVALLGTIAWRALAGYSSLFAGLVMVGVLVQPFTATMTSSLYTETVNMFLLTVSLVFFARSYIKRRAPVAASFFLGLASLTRIELIPLTVALGAFYWFMINFRQTASLRTTSQKVNGALIMFLALVAPLVGMVALQIFSTGQVGLVHFESRNPGYYAWMRTWFANDKEYARFAFGLGRPGWEGFQLDAYPRKAFLDDKEREAVGDLLTQWSTRGYTPQVDRSFATISDNKKRLSPITYFLAIPLMRLANFWINLDGAQSLLRSVELQRPYSLIVVGITILLRAFFIVFALIGCLTVWIPRSAYRFPIFLRVLGQAASVLVALRTMELVVLSTMFWGGLMEIRYANITFPAVILLSVIGFRALLQKGADDTSMWPRKGVSPNQGQPNESDMVGNWRLV